MHRNSRLLYINASALTVSGSTCLILDWLLPPGQASLPCQARHASCLGSIATAAAA